MNHFKTHLTAVFCIAGATLLSCSAYADNAKITAEDIQSKTVSSPWGEQGKITIGDQPFAQVPGQPGQPGNPNHPSNPGPKRGETVVGRLRELLSYREKLKRSDIRPIPVGDGEWVVGVNANYLKQSFGDSKPLKYNGKDYYFAVTADSTYVKLKRTSASALATKLSDVLFDDLRLPKPKGKAEYFGPVTDNDFNKLDEVGCCNAGNDYLESRSYKLAERAFLQAIAKANEKHVPYPAAHLCLLLAQIYEAQYVSPDSPEKAVYIAKAKETLAEIQTLNQFDAEDLQAIATQKATLTELERKLTPAPVSNHTPVSPPTTDPNAPEAKE